MPTVGATVQSGPENDVDLDLALKTHAGWKVRFRSAIVARETLDDVTIGKDNCCELGAWLYGEAGARYGQLRSYRACVDSHARFHVEAGKVARAVNDQRFREAEKMLNFDTPYTEASNEVSAAIGMLRREAGI